MMFGMWGRADRQSALADVAVELLRHRGHEFVGEPEPVREVDVRMVGTAALATLNYPTRVHKLVVKSTVLNTGIKSPTEGKRVLQRLAASDLDIADYLQPVLGADEPTQSLIMRYVDGEPLSHRLLRELQGSVALSEATHDALRQCAAVLAALHRLQASDVLTSPHIRENASFVGTFEAGWSHFSSTSRRSGFANASALLDRLTPDFCARRGDHMLLIDAQPKNVIVRPSGRVCFIDLNFSAAPAAMGVAQFLGALDRRGSRFPDKVNQKRISLWQRTFVEAYCARGDAKISQDLIFFYPWAVMQVFDQHRRLWPRFTPYLRWYYGRRLAAFLSALRDLSPDVVKRSPAELFPES